eukprot:TRINITY_DN37865_c0_g1_i1.p1 TRINITY_DN37865_c0_g1~~TRINITY_DN37865_c0_g1_i1.p1  ORF type:complete len:207 (+),score=22.62 TRINITY_DN37865_c0_g1_i1:50-670(+)
MLKNLRRVVARGQKRGLLDQMGPGHSVKGDTMSHVPPSVIVYSQEGRYTKVKWEGDTEVWEGPNHDTNGEIFSWVMPFNDSTQQAVKIGSWGSVLEAHASLSASLYMKTEKKYQTRPATITRSLQCAHAKEVSLHGKAFIRSLIQHYSRNSRHVTVFSEVVSEGSPPYVCIRMVSNIMVLKEAQDVPRADNDHFSFHSDTKKSNKQ